MSRQTGHFIFLPISSNIYGSMSVGNEIEDPCDLAYFLRCQSVSQHATWAENTDIT